MGGWVTRSRSKTARAFHHLYSVPMPGDYWNPSGPPSLARKDESCSSEGPASKTGSSHMPRNLHLGVGRNDPVCTLTMMRQAIRRGGAMHFRSSQAESRRRRAGENGSRGHAREGSHRSLPPRPLFVQSASGLQPALLLAPGRSRFESTVRRLRFRLFVHLVDILRGAVGGWGLSVRGPGPLISRAVRRNHIASRAVCTRVASCVAAANVPAPDFHFFLWASCKDAPVSRFECVKTP